MGNCFNKYKVGDRGDPYTKTFKRGTYDLDDKANDGDISLSSSSISSAHSAIPKLMYFASTESPPHLKDKRKLQKLAATGDELKPPGFESSGSSMLLPSSEDYWVRNMKKPKRSDEKEVAKFLSECAMPRPDKVDFAFCQGGDGVIVIEKTVIGTGAFSVVKTATLAQVADSKEMAVKVVDLAMFKKKKELLYLMEREINIITRLKHPNIIQVHSVFIYKEMIHILMELAPNGSLWEYLNDNGALSEARAQKWFRQISDGIWYCHSLDIAHRDLKSDNILFDEDFNVKITDFGLSRLYKPDMSLSETLCGTMQYVAPEIISNKPYNPLMADVWSLGICLFAMLHAELPFTEQQLKNHIDSQEGSPDVASIGDTPMLYPVIKASVSASAKELLLKLLQIDPKTRLTMHEVCAHPWVGSLHSNQINAIRMRSQEAHRMVT